jgi:heme A synthase
MGMSLEEFKNIFFWEWAHRMAGRTSGLVFGIPLLYFMARGKVKGKLARRLAMLLGLGATQGMIGWWMVRSGLEEPEHEHYEPKVSPYRLATHLLSAFLIYTILLDSAMKTWPAKAGSLLQRHKAAPPQLRGLAMGLLHTLAVTIGVGAFVAGTRVSWSGILSWMRFVPFFYVCTNMRHLLVSCRSFFFYCTTTVLTGWLDLQRMATYGRSILPRGSCRQNTQACMAQCV